MCIRDSHQTDYSSAFPFPNSLSTYTPTQRERIPSIRELAVTLQVNPNTVMRAYDKLGSDGLILIRRGMGFFVAEGSQARTLEAQRHEFIRVELHTMFARMDELGIDMNDLQTLHNNYLKRKSHELY